MHIDEFDGIIGDHVLSLKQVEQDNMHADDERVPHVPFGFNNPQWEELKRAVTEKSELREFDFPQSDWDVGMGSCGYLLIEDSFIIGSIVTGMN